MKIAKRIGMTAMTAVMALGLVGCTFEGSQYSPEQVINNALEEITTVGAYYSEEEVVFSEKGQVVEHSISKQWHSDDGKIRIESESIAGENKFVVVHDGKTSTMHFVNENEAFTYENTEQPLAQPSLKEQANILLKMVEDTHAISIEGEEKILNRKTYHLVAKANKTNTLLGDIEMWIDKENWMVLKSISNTGDSSFESNYTKLDFDMKMPAETFTLELPEDVVIKDLQDISKSTEVTLEGARESLGQPLLYLPETDRLELIKIEMNEIGDDHKEVSFEYEKEGLPLFSISLFLAPEEVVEGGLIIPGEKTVTIRGQEGNLMEMGDYRAVFWKENGIRYSVMLISPSLSFDEFIEMTNGMELVK